MNYHELPEWSGWLASIREQPEDDNRRLFCADWLDELETEEARQRAEFIRCQVRADSLRMRGCPSVFLPDEPNGPDDLAECRKRANAIAKRHTHRWLGVPSQFVSIPGATASRFATQEEAAAAPHMHFSRGFVTRVSAPLAVLHGGACLRCSPRRRMARQIEQSEGWALGYHARGLADDLMALYDPCPNCVDGRTPGVLGELLRREPVTAAGIEVTQVSPVGVVPNEYLRSGTGPERNWAWGFSESTPHGEYMIPREVWDLMPPTKLAEPRGRFKVFPTQDTARLALIEALYRLHGPKSEVTT